MKKILSNVQKFYLTIFQQKYVIYFKTLQAVKEKTLCYLTYVYPKILGKGSDPFYLVKNLVYYSGNLYLMLS